MFKLYKIDGSIVEFTTEEGALKTMAAFPEKFFLTLEEEPEVEENNLKLMDDDEIKKYFPGE